MDEEDALRPCSSCASFDQPSDFKNEGNNKYRFPPGVDLGTSYGSYLHSSASPLKALQKPAAPKSNRDRHGVSSIPKLPALVADRSTKRNVIRKEEERDSNEYGRMEKSFGGTHARSHTYATKESSRFNSSVSTIYIDLQLLIQSLADLKGRLKHAGFDTTVLRAACNTLKPAHLELRAVVDRLDKGGGDPLITAETLQLVMVYIQTVMQALVDQTENMRPSGEEPRGWDQIQQEQIEALMQYYHEKEAELKSLRRICQSTEAELQGTRRYCDKLRQYLAATEEKAASSHSELQSQLEVARRLLLSVTRELDEERTKAQEMKLLACQKDRELKQAKTKQMELLQNPLEKEICKLQNELDRQHKVERQLRIQMQNDGVKISRLKSKLTASRGYHLLARQSQKRRSKISKANAQTSNMVHQGDSITSGGNIFPAYQQQPTRAEASKGHSKLKPFSFTSVELAEMAYFSDPATASKTLSTLKKQGLLWK